MRTPLFGARPRRDHVGRGLHGGRPAARAGHQGCATGAVAGAPSASEGMHERRMGSPIRLALKRLRVVPRGPRDRRTANRRSIALLSELSKRRADCPHHTAQQFVASSSPSQRRESRRGDGSKSQRRPVISIAAGQRRSVDRNQSKSCGSRGPRKRDQRAAGLIPQGQRNASNALPKGDARDQTQVRALLQHAL